MKRVLFVCTGNVCRSPMAEALFRLRMGGRLECESLSAGVASTDGLAPSENAVAAMRDLNVDIRGQRSQSISAQLINSVDYIFGMTRRHVDELLYYFPHAAEKTFLVREFDPSLNDAQKDIADPIGGSLDVYRHCRDQIDGALESMADFIEKTSDKHTDSGVKSAATIGVGSDHAGYELKQALVAHLRAEGLAVHDFGAHSDVSTDYPDYALPVSHAVVDGEADFGLLVCSSGIGMSIAANKVAGVHAALVSDPDTARLSREHNDANVLCLAARSLSVESAKEVVDAFLGAAFQGGRHDGRVRKADTGGRVSSARVRAVDPEVADRLDAERKRQMENIELIASENFTSPAVMEAQGSTLTNKYAEGYPGKRWYGGCEYVDDVEDLARERAKALFGADHANVQPHSGSGANMAAYFSVLEPGDKLLTMDLSHGGHLTHGNKANFSGRFFEIVHYGVDKDSERIDYDQLAALARETRPKMITVGASAYSRIIDFERMGQIAKETGAYLLADIAHIAGLVAAGLHPSPVPHADFVTTTTHKTLRGPRGGLILCREEHAKKVDSNTFPGIQGGPLMHVIAAKAVCLKEAADPSFRTYQEQVIKNARALAEGMARNQFRIVSGGTDNHCMLVDVGARDLTGKQCQHALDEAGVTANKNTIPFETRSPFQASGVRLGSPAVTTRGMKEPEMAAIADMIAEVLLDIKNVDAQSAVRQRVRELTARYPLPY